MKEGWEIIAAAGIGMIGLWAMRDLQSVRPKVGATRPHKAFLQVLKALGYPLKYGYHLFVGTYRHNSTFGMLIATVYISLVAGPARIIVKWITEGMAETPLREIGMGASDTAQWGAVGVAGFLFLYGGLSISKALANAVAWLVLGSNELPDTPCDIKTIVKENKSIGERLEQLVKSLDESIRDLMDVESWIRKDKLRQKIENYTGKITPDHNMLIPLIISADSLLPVSWREIGYPTTRMYLRKQSMWYARTWTEDTMDDARYFIYKKECDKCDKCNGLETSIKETIKKCIGRLNDNFYKATQYPGKKFQPVGNDPKPPRAIRIVIGSIDDLAAAAEMLDDDLREAKHNNGILNLWICEGAVSRWDKDAWMGGEADFEPAIRNWISDLKEFVEVHIGSGRSQELDRLYHPLAHIQNFSAQYKRNEFIAIGGKLSVLGYNANGTRTGLRAKLDFIVWLHTILMALDFKKVLPLTELCGLFTDNAYRDEGQRRALMLSVQSFQVG